jgi:hypothetical protein
MRSHLVATSPAPLRKLLLVALLAPGCDRAPGAPVSTRPQIVLTGPGVPGTVSVQQIAVGNLDGSDIVRIPQDNHNKFLAHFSPDGTRLIYTKFLAGKYGDPAPETDIFTYSFSSAAETRLTSVGTAFQAAWSPDGTQIVLGNYAGTGLSIMNADGSGQRVLAEASGAPDDIRWHDPAWSSDNWIYFVVEQTTNDCLKVRLDRIRPDGTSRTPVTDGGPNCTPPNREPYGDADPGLSADGQTVYSSRGLSPLPADSTQTLRHLYAYASSAYTAGKVETDLSIAMKPDCTVGVPKGSPDGARILVALFCPDDPAHIGVTLTDTAGSSWTFITADNGADWNPTTTP